jgi:hypothetical protein
MDDCIYFTTESGDRSGLESRVRFILSRISDEIVSITDVDLHANLSAVAYEKTFYGDFFAYAVVSYI